MIIWIAIIGGSPERLLDGPHHVLARSARPTLVNVYLFLLIFDQLAERGRCRDRWSKSLGQF